MRSHPYAGIVLAAGMAMAVSAAHAQDERRGLGPHVHGHGTLAIAIEGNDVQMELVAPGMDIVGFEHEPETERQKKSVEAALADLKEPLKLFLLPGATGCTVTSADVKIVTGEHEDHQPAQEAGSTAETDEDEDGHTEFRATYALACTDASLIRFIHFAFFQRFREADKLQVTIIDPNGETTAQVSRQAPELEN